MMGMVQRQEVEFAINLFFITPPREIDADFTEAVHIDNEAILMVRPTLENDMTGFLKPFTTTVWLLVLVSLLAIIAAMTSVTWVENRIFETDQKASLSKVPLWAVQTVSQESSHWLPEKDIGRLLVAIWLLASLVFMSSYSGILTALLTVPIVTVPIDSLSELVSQTDLPWRLQSGSVMYQVFLEAEDPIRKRAFTHKSGTIPDCWSGREAIANGEYAVICDETTMRKAMSWDFSRSGVCHLYISKEKVYSNGLLSIPFRINSSYIPKANEIIRKLRESGIVNKWLGEQMPNSTQCLRPPKSDKREGIEALDIKAFSGPFLFLIGGNFLALLAFLGERNVGPNKD
ncbi:glutamate receptor ionotropic, delta-2-like [Palaemon carinicauda]|uniref:glutamate receptor ionotropic, delta-2-like n=1 Tax=Palaemon carinicauda TaxID=392227 RepID=UPI0035B62727